MKNQDLLMKFIDGHLDTAEEEKLFRIMSRDNILRSNLKQFIQIDGSSYAAAAETVPAAASTAALFGNLGFNYAAINTAAGSRGIFDKGVIFFKENLASILSAIVASLLTIATIYFIDNFDFKKSDSKAANSLKENAVPVQIYYQDNLSSAVENSGNEQYLSSNHLTSSNSNLAQRQGYYSNSNNSLIEKNKIFTKNRNLDEVLSENKSADENSKTVENNRWDFPIINPIPVRELLSSNQSNVIILKDNRLNISSAPVVLNNPIIDDNLAMTYRKNRFGLEIKNGSFINFPVATITPEKFAPFYNTALSLDYAFTEHWKLGIDLRQETFFLLLTGNEIDEQNQVRIFEYQMQPNFTSYSLFGEYNHKLYSDFYMLGRVYLGANTYGYLGRLAGGLEFNVNSYLSLMLLGQYSYFQYDHQNNQFNAKKAGLEYGIKFKF